MKRIAIIGLGGISKFYLKAIEKESQIKLTAVCDLDKDKTLLYKKLKVATFNSVTELLLNGQFDVVIITTPNDTHFDIINKCLNAGKHVLCEKPLALTLKQVKKITYVAERKNLLLMTAFHRRYNRNIVKLPEAKKTRFIYACYLEDIIMHSSNEPWYLDTKRSGGGCVMDNGINVFDMLLHLFGELTLKTAYIEYRKQKKNLYDSKALILLEYSQGYIFTELNWHYKNEIKDLMIFSDNGVLKHVDLLAGSNKFKGSLWHEYEGVLKDFLLRLKQNKHTADTNSIMAMQLVDQVYKSGVKSIL